MRKFISLVIAGMLTLSLAACSNSSADTTEESTSETATSESAEYDLGLDDNGYFRDVIAKKYISMPRGWEDYTVSADTYSVSDEDIDSEMQAFATYYKLTTPIEGRAAQTGDVVDINYEGSVNGVPFTGGTANNYLLELGSGQFIDGFEDQIIGHSAGDEFDVTVTFPDGYGTTTDRETGETEIDLSNAQAVFHVTLNEIEEYNIEDADVADIMYGKTLEDGTDVNTVETLREYTEETLRMNAITSVVQQYFIDNAEINRDDSRLVNYYLETNRNYIAAEAAAYNMDADTYVASNSDYQTLNDYIDSLQQTAEENVLLSLVAQYMAEEQDYVPTEDEVRDFIGDTYDDEAELYGKGTLAHELLYNKVMGEYCVQVYQNSLVANAE